jgi:hypothetical protein
MLKDDAPCFMDICFEGFQQFRKEKMKAIQESIAQGDFMIHPKIIASNWLNHEFQNFQIPEQIEE